jgi:ABC-2 type transport system permease protein
METSMTSAAARLGPFRSRLGAMLATARMRLLLVSRYRGQLFVEILIPIVFASMPILLAQANGEGAVANFQRNVGTANYVAYMLLGSSSFMVVSMAFWHIGYWVRFEQETGTLEAVYLAPTGRVWLAAGVAIYSALRALLAGGLAYLLGSLIFGIGPLQGQLLLAGSFVAVGLVPLFGMTLLFGALILRVKEANSLVNLMQWAISLLMGIFFPVAVFPPLMRALALLFPPTWMINGVRSAMLGVGYFFGVWYRDLAVLWAFLLVAPLLGYSAFTRMERSIRRREGMGTF